MPEPTWHVAVALTAAPIFDDAIYLSEALGLPATTQTEDDIDAELLLLARESGIQDPYRFLCPPQYISRAISTMTVDSEPRSSVSVHSQETESTSFTSAPSRTSKDQLYSERSPARRFPPPFKRHSLSTDRCIPALSGSTPKKAPARSNSTLSVSKSVLSSSSSLQQQPPPRKKRTSNLFSIFRKDSSSCSSRSHHGLHSKSRGSKLVCGHTLSEFAIRVHVQESANHVVPNCCGIALPRTVLESVLTRKEMDLVLKSDEVQSPDINSLPDSGYSENEMSSIDLARSNSTAQPVSPPEVPVASVHRTSCEETSVDPALANEAFTILKFQQKEQLERVATFECNQRKALSAHHQCSLKRLAAQHKTGRDERIEQHIIDLERLEEKQISAEHDLRTAHEQETQNVATALKHMEAYCLGTNANHPEHAHVVTEDDFKKLDRQRMMQQNLPRKHENAINVLRARQERETRRRIEKQEAELISMDAEHEKEMLTEETNHKKEIERLDTIIEARRKRLLQRWDLKFEIWRKEWEEQHSMTLDAKLEHEQFPPREEDHEISISESSTLAQYVNATA